MYTHQYTAHTHTHTSMYSASDNKNFNLTDPLSQILVRSILKAQCFAASNGMKAYIK